MTAEINWTSSANFIATAHRDEHRLIVTVSPIPAILPDDVPVWRVVAFATKHTEAEAVLAEHAHKNLGDYEDFRDAFEDAEAFIKQWLSGTSLAQCTCGEIAAS